MHNYPPWYSALNEFDHYLYAVIALLFVVLSISIVVVVSRLGWRQHLRWANPFAVSCILTGCERFLKDMHYFFGIGSRWNAYLAETVLSYLATAIGTYSTYMLWRTLRDLARHPVSPDPLAEHPVQPGVWPPPPVVKR